jgi:citrate synthase
VVVLTPSRAFVALGDLQVACSQRNRVRNLFTLIAATYAWDISHHGNAARLMGFFHRLFRLRDPYPPGRRLEKVLEELESENKKKNKKTIRISQGPCRTLE